MEDEGGGAKMTKKRRCEVSREGISRNWANLPVEILCLITTQLCYYGRIRFRSVCKSWRDSCHISSCDRLPFLMNFNPSNLMKSCEFINMSVHGQVCDNINTSRIENPMYAEDNRNMKHVVLSSKKGWLLLAAEEEPYQLVMYNPFKKEMIKLPTVDIAAKRPPGREFQAEMSESPEEEGFMVFVIDGITCRYENQKRIATWQRSHTSWKKYSFETGQQFPYHCLDVVYNRNRGMFYCLFTSECLGIFNPMAGEWSFLEPWIQKSTDGNGRLIEAEDEPLLFTLDRSIFKLDRSSSRLSWMKQKDLGNRILFITCQAERWPRTTVIAVPAEGELRNLANGVYFNFHSLGTNSNPDILSKRAWIEPPLLPLEYPMEQ